MMVKKIISVGLLTLVCFSLVACGDTQKTPSIELNEISQDEVKVETQKQKVEDSKKITTISNSTLDLLDNYKSSFLEMLENEDINADVETTSDNVTITTETTSQRESISEQLNNKAKEIATSFQEKGDDFSINYNLIYNYIDIYCDKDSIDSSKDDINQLIGIIACYERINDNTKDWSVQVIINDSESKEIITQIGVTDEDVYSFTSNDWGVATEEVTTESDTTTIDEEVSEN